MKFDCLDEQWLNSVFEPLLIAPRSWCDRYGEPDDELEDDE